MITPTGVTSEAYWNAIKNGNATHFRITFTSQNIVLDDSDINISGGVNLTDIFNGDTDLVMGKALCKQINISIINTGRLNGLDWTEEFTAEFGVEINGSTNWVTVGYFQGEKPTNLTTSKIIDFVAYDRMKQFDSLSDKFVKEIEYPATVQDIYDSLCAYLEIENEQGDELPNIMSRSFESAPVEFEGYTYRDILAWIAEACGCYARINASGNVQLLWFTGNTNHVITQNEEFNVKAIDIHDGITWDEAEELTWDEIDNIAWEEVSGSLADYKIEQIKVKQVSNDLEINYPNNFGQNVYLIVDNPFLNVWEEQDKSDYIAPLYDRINGFSGYIPFSADCVGSWLVEAGDIISINIYGHIMNIPIFIKEMSWNGAVTDSYETTGNKNRPVYADTKNKEKVMSSNEIKLLVGNGYYKKQSGVVIDQDGVSITGNKSIILDSDGSVLIHAGHEFDKWNFDAEGLVFEGHAIVSDEPVESQAVRFGIIPFTGGQVPDSECGIHPSYNENANYANLILKVWKYRSNAGSDVRQSAFLHIDAIDTQRNPDFPFDEGSQVCVYTDLTPGSDYSGLLGSDDNRWREVWARTVHAWYIDTESSKVIKEDIAPLKDFGDAIDKLKPVSFRYKEKARAAKGVNGRISYGLIYEDTVKVMPGICNGDEEHKAINYMNLIPVLLKEIQSLRKRVSELESKVKGDEK